MVATPLFPFGGHAGEVIFQSAFHRGNGCYAQYACLGHTHFVPFSPLFIAAMVDLIAVLAYKILCPLFIAAMVAT